MNINRAPNEIKEENYNKDMNSTLLRIIFKVIVMMKLLK